MGKGGKGGKGESDLRRFIQGRRHATWFEQHFPDDELSDFATRVGEGLVFALCSVRAWLMVFITCLATLLCSPAFLDFAWATSMGIVAAGTVFPLVFAIQAAYTARNGAIKCLGMLKARMAFLYFQTKALDAQYKTEIAPIVSTFSSNMGIAVIQAMIQDDLESSQVCYDLISGLIAETTPLAAEKYPPPVFSMIAATYHMLLVDLEGVRETRDNETPKGLRKFAIFLIVTTPVMLAPFWSNFCKSASDGHKKVLEDGTVIDPHQYGCIAAYFIAVVYVIITFSLLRVQEALEDPFDGMGEDDIQWQCFARNLDEVEDYGTDGVDKRGQKSDFEVVRLYQAATGKSD